MNRKSAASRFPLPAARLSCLLSVAWCLATSACDAPKDEGLRKVRVAYEQHLGWAPLMIAQAEGFFRDEGLDVEMVLGMQPEDGLVALITGNIDVRPGALHAAFLSAVARGAPIRIVAGSGVLDPEGCTYYGIVLRPGLDSSGTPDVRSIRTSIDGSTRYVASRMLGQRGVSIDRMETMRVQDVMLAMALEKGSIDAAAVTEPALTRLAKIGTLWLSGQDAAPGYQWSVLAMGERMTVRDRDTGLRFMRAWHRAVAQLRQGKTDRNVAILAEANGETVEHTREACWPSFTADSRVNWQSIDEFQHWAKSQGFMERTVTAAQALDSTLVAETAPKQ